MTALVHLFVGVGPIAIAFARRNSVVWDGNV